MRVFVSGHSANFGDRFGVEYAKSRGHTVCEVRGRVGGNFHMLCGSVLPKATDGTVAWGCGALTSDFVMLGKPDVRCSRGPRTRKRLTELIGTIPDEIGDSGLLMPKTFGIKAHPRYDVGIAPYHKRFGDPEFARFGGNGVLMIDVARPVRDVVEEVASCSVVLCGSLHAMVCADALGIPATYFDTIPPYRDFKWYDYLESVGRHDRFMTTNDVERLGDVTRNAQPANPDSVSALIENLTRSDPT
jgi:hypothetical protein